MAWYRHQLEGWPCASFQRCPMIEMQLKGQLLEELSKSLKEWWGWVGANEWAEAVTGMAWNTARVACCQCRLIIIRTEKEGRRCEKEGHVGCPEWWWVVIVWLWARRECVGGTHDEGTALRWICRVSHGSHRGWHMHIPHPHPQTTHFNTIPVWTGLNHRF